MTDNNVFVARDDMHYDRAMYSLIKRVVYLTTKVKRTVVRGNCLGYYDDKDEEIANTIPSTRKIVLTDKIDEETRSEIKKILGEGQ